MVGKYEKLCVDVEDLLIETISKLRQAYELSQKFSLGLANKIDDIKLEVMAEATKANMLRCFSHRIENDK